MAVKKSEFISTVIWVVSAFVIALAIRSFFFEPFRIPSGSMRPSLEAGDFIFVSKYNYGYGRYSFPFGLGKFQGRILDFNQPERGDIIVFRNPAEPSRSFVKRLIGLPGDRIQLKEGVLMINGKAVARTPAEPYSFLIDGNNVLVLRYQERFSEGYQHQIIEIQGDKGSFDNTIEYLVPKEHYFMMGDNRDGSQDSRFLAEVGFVPYENLIGPARFIWFSFDKERPWYRFLRPERFFQGLDKQK